MKKFMIVSLLVALVAGAWTPMVKADTASDLKQAADIAKVVNDVVMPILALPIQLAVSSKKLTQDQADLITASLKLGPIALITANQLSISTVALPDQVLSTARKLGLATAKLNAASTAATATVTTRDQQAKQLIAYLTAQGEFFDIIASFFANLNTDIFQPTFSFVQGIPKVGEKMVLNPATYGYKKDPVTKEVIKDSAGNPVKITVGDYVGMMLTNMKVRNDAFIKLVKVLPEFMEPAATTTTKPGEQPKKEEAKVELVDIFG